MTHLAILRHGPTDWNAEGRFQGRADRFLSEEGRLDVASWRLPEDVKAWRVIASHDKPWLAKASQRGCIITDTSDNGRHRLPLRYRQHNRD